MEVKRCVYYEQPHHLSLWPAATTPQMTTGLPLRDALCCERQEAAMLGRQHRSLMCWNRLAGQERGPLTEGTMMPKHSRFCTQLTTSTHLGTDLSHTSPSNPLTTSKKKASQTSTHLLVRILSPDLLPSNCLRRILLSIIINQASSFNALTVAPSDFVTTHSFLVPWTSFHFATFLRGFGPLSLTFRPLTFVKLSFTHKTSHHEAPGHRIQQPWPHSADPASPLQSASSATREYRSPALTAHPLPARSLQLVIAMLVVSLPSKCTFIR